MKKSNQTILIYFLVVCILFISGCSKEDIVYTAAKSVSVTVVNTEKLPVLSHTDYQQEQEKDGKIVVHNDGSDGYEEYLIDSMEAYDCTLLPIEDTEYAVSGTFSVPAEHCAFIIAQPEEDMEVNELRIDDMTKGENLRKAADNTKDLFEALNYYSVSDGYPKILGSIITNSGFGSQERNYELIISRNENGSNFKKGKLDDGKIKVWVICYPCT